MADTTMRRPASAPKGRGRTPTEAELRHAENATWGPRPDAADRPKMRLLDFRPVVKGALRAFARIELPPGLYIPDAMVFTSQGKSWAALPSKPALDADGRQKRDADGKLQYLPAVQWKNRELQERFSAALIQLVREQFPGALDEGAR
jgi:hypothetical protein